MGRARHRLLVNHDAMSFRGDGIRHGVDFDGDGLKLLNSGATIRGADGVAVNITRQATEADPAAITAYSAHAAGATAVTSNAATDLDTTAAALATLRGEVNTLRTTVVNILAKLEAAGVFASS